MVQSSESNSASISEIEGAVKALAEIVGILEENWRGCLGVEYIEYAMPMVAPDSSDRITQITSNLYNLRERVVAVKNSIQARS